MNDDEKMAKILKENAAFNRKLDDAHTAKLKEEGKIMFAIWGLWICVGIAIGIPIGKFLL